MDQMEATSPITILLFSNDANTYHHTQTLHALPKPGSRAHNLTQPNI